MTGPCAKRRVLARLTGRSGRVYVGENLCATPVQTCPREVGEGYEKCRTVCGQLHHAEIQALTLAGQDARGGAIEIGYHYACDACIAAMRAAGIATATFSETP